MTYHTTVKGMVIGLCMVYTMSVLGMHDDQREQELINPVAAADNQQSFLTRLIHPYISKAVLNDTSAIKTPLPTNSSPVATLPANDSFSKKKLLLISTGLLFAGIIGYELGSMCQDCVTKLKDTEQLAGDIKKSYDACENRTQHLTMSLENCYESCSNRTQYLTMLLEECIESRDSIIDAIVEYCSGQ